MRLALCRELRGGVPFRFARGGRKKWSAVLRAEADFDARLAWVRIDLMCCEACGEMAVWWHEPTISFGCEACTDPFCESCFTCLGSMSCCDYGYSREGFWWDEGTLRDSLP